jgi:3-methyladenine DNA glycosylase/8-oxoguanine DNA glycosylase
VIRPLNAIAIASRNNDSDVLNGLGDVEVTQHLSRLKGVGDDLH